MRNAFLYKKNIANLKVQSMTYVRQGKPHPIPPHGKGTTKTRDVGVSPAIIPPHGKGATKTRDVGVSPATEKNCQSE